MIKINELTNKNISPSIVDGPFGSLLTKEDLTSDSNKGIPYIDFEQMKNGFKITTYVKTESLKKLKRFIVKPNDVLFIKLVNIGYSKVVPQTINEAIISNKIIKLSIDNKMINPYYLSNIFNKLRKINYYDRFISNSTIKTFKISDFKEIKIDISNITQEKIETLNKSIQKQDMIIKKLNNRLNLSNKYFKNLTQELLSGNIKVLLNGTLEKNNQHKEWKNKKLIDIAEFNRGKLINKKDILKEGKNKILRIKDTMPSYLSNKINSFNKSKIYTNVDYDNKFYKNKKDIVLCLDGRNKVPFEGTVGMVTKKGEGIINNELYIVKSKDNNVLNNDFLYYSLFKNNIQRDISRYCEGNVIFHAHKAKNILKTNLPSLSEQKRIVQILNKFEKEITILEKKIKLEEKVYDYILNLF